MWLSLVGIMLLCIDVLGWIIQIKEVVDCLILIGCLVLYGYDDLLCCMLVMCLSGVNSIYIYENMGIFDMLGYVFGGGSVINYGFDYNCVFQINGCLVDNDFYVWINNYNVMCSYVVNGLD